MGWKPPSGEDLSEMSWKWRHKVSSMIKSNDKTLDDFPSESSYSGLKPKAPPTGKAGTIPMPSKDAQQDFGGALVVKTLYEGKNSTDSAFDWQDYPPRLASKGASKAHDRVALKVYKAKDKEKPVVNGRFALKFHRLDVQNPLLLSALEPILKKEDMHIDVNETATFKEPFRPLFFRYDEIAELHSGLEDNEPLRPYLRLLLGTLDEMFAEVRAKRNQLASAGLISFKHAWTYFPRDAIVYGSLSTGERLYKAIDTAVEASKEMGLVLAVRAKYLKFNGDAFVWNETKLMIPHFEGNKPIVDLPVYPLEFGKDVEAAKERMQARGRLLLDYQSLTYCTYQGVALHSGDQGCMEKHTVDSRILLDVVGYRKHHLAMGTRQGKDADTVKNVVKGTGRAAGGKLTVKSKASSWKRLTEEEATRNTSVMLENPNELMFMASFVEGYALKNKMWFMFMLEDIKPMEFNESAFEHLVYDEQQKDLVLSFVENHDHVKSGVTDVIKGKGDGLVILLSGPPGTGKTLTAEAVADRTHRPLLYLQAEDLGINAATLAANMKNILNLATEWDAVILLDEADVFMAERNPQDIARNELVSIFLRELEYYRGIIFLTTNLFATIDTAFRSRVSLHLLFRSLSVDARVSIWQKFLERMPVKVLSESQNQVEEGKDSEGLLTNEDVKELALWELNGREIKTALKMVNSWCQHKGYDMTLERLENGIKVTSPHASKGSAVDTLYD